MMYDATTAAAALGITPRAIRRMLRRSPEFVPVGSGGRYQLTESDVALLGSRITAAVEADPHFLDDDQGVSVAVMIRAKRDPFVRADVMRRRRDRYDRLDARRSELGLPTMYPVG